MSVLAHVFEAAGIATLTLASMRPVVEKMAPPRALYCEFPLGRPLGHPGDAEFQLDVLARAFALLDATEGPVLADHPVVIEADETAVSCQIPPAYDPDVHPAVAEARGLRKAWDRTFADRGVTSVGRSVDADGVPDALDLFRQIADGAPWKSVELPGKNTTALCHDIRTYYEEAALALVDGPSPAGRALEAWYFEQTEAGRLILATRSEMQRQEAPMAAWFYMAPGHRS